MNLAIARYRFLYVDEQYTDVARLLLTALILVLCRERGVKIFGFKHDFLNRVVCFSTEVWYFGVIFQSH